uniref:Uncharacterized protein n=1 Tax=Arundo donax TaxID=35708 RepID=A0A0A8ZD40_ARUDO
MKFNRVIAIFSSSLYCNEECVSACCHILPVEKKGHGKHNYI